MKFIIYSQYYPPEIGAPQARLSDLAERLAKYGHEVFVLTAIPNYPLGRIYDGYGGLFEFNFKSAVRIIRTFIYPTKSVKLLPRLVNYFSFILSSFILGIILLPKADYVITESPPLFLGISGFLLSRFKGAKWIFNVSDLWPESAVRLGIIRRGKLLQIAERLEAFCYSKAWLVMGQSHEILQGVKQKTPKASSYHLSNGVDSTLYSPNLRSTKLHHELGDGAELVAIYCGLHGIAQGLDQIIEAAKLLNDLNGKLKIVFIGDGNQKLSLMHQAQGIEMIKFLDPYKREQIPKVIASADISIVPLRLYLPGAVPSKLYEAMACALPVILAAKGEAASIIKITKAGIVIEPGAANHLAHALRRLVLEPNLRQKLGQNARNGAVNLFDREQIVSNFVNFLAKYRNN